MENWKFALSSILGHKMRSFLTTLGVIIGVASVVVIMALGQGMTNQVTNMFASDSQDVQLYYTTKKTDNIDVFDDTDPREADKGPAIKEEWLQKITSELQDVENYYLTNSTTSTVEGNQKKSKNVNITGVNRTYFTVKNYKVLAGRSLETGDYSRFSRIVMLDTKLAVKLFGSNENALNQHVSIGSKNYLVVGVYKDPNAGSQQYGMQSGGNAVMTNTQLAAEFNVDEVQAAFVHVEDVKQTTKVGKEAALDAVVRGENWSFYNLRHVTSYFASQLCLQHDDSSYWCYRRYFSSCWWYWGYEYHVGICYRAYTRNWFTKSSWSNPSKDFDTIFD